MAKSLRNKVTVQSTVTAYRCKMATVLNGVDSSTEMTANAWQQTVLAVIDATMKLSIQSFETATPVVQQQQGHE